MLARPSPGKRRRSTHHEASPGEMAPDLSDTMASWMQHKMEQSEDDGNRSQARIDLEQDKFKFEKDLQQSRDDEKVKLVQREIDRDDKRIKLEHDRLVAEIDARKAETALATLRENNRAEEAKRQADVTAAANNKQTDMMMQVLKLAMEGRST